MSVFDRLSSTASSILSIPFDVFGSVVGSFVGSATAPLVDSLMKVGMLALAFLVVLAVVL